MTAKMEPSRSGRLQQQRELVEKMQTLLGQESRREFPVQAGGESYNYVILRPKGSKSEIAIGENAGDLPRSRHYIFFDAAGRFTRSWGHSSNPLSPEPSENWGLKGSQTSGIAPREAWEWFNLIISSLKKKKIQHVQSFMPLKVPGGLPLSAPSLSL